MMLGEHRQWESAYDEAAVVKIPLKEFAGERVSFTYGEYDFKRSIYPTDKPINHHLKYVEAHVWDDDVLARYW